MSVSYFGIRHHGPGCARALQQALVALAPDIILLEGPPEADGIVGLAADPAMQPPVALLIYPTEAPQHGVFYPFALFSPEWQAIQHAQQAGVPLWFMDLPATHGFAQAMAAEQTADTDEEGDAPDETLAAWRMDPIGELSRAAGYEDHELWWEVEIEQRRDASELFAAIAEAMTALREHAPPPDLREARREAHMRSRVREAQKAGYQRIAVVCGAWHVPALCQAATAKADMALLKGLPKTRTAATWVPWSDDRLAYASGYGAGVSSPGWYRHLWQCAEGTSERWVTRAARLLREAGLDASSASVIETVRLSEALAALRDLPLPGLAEQQQAMLTVLCHGDPLPMALIRQQLEVGDHLGSVPEGCIDAPLLRDLEAEQKRLRLKPSTENKRLELDLREESGRHRSCLLHRLNVLDVGWGKPLADSNRTGTFRESWDLRWSPDMVVALIAASRYGNTLALAASRQLSERAGQSRHLPELTGMLYVAMLAKLPVAASVLLAAVQNQAAVAADLGHLMDALPPLVRVARYGDVRGTEAASVLPITTTLVERVTVGLGAAATQMDEAAAEVLVERMGMMQTAIDTLDDPLLRDDWLDCLQVLAGQDSAAPAVQGYALRLAFDRQRIDAAQLAQQARLALAPSMPPAQSTGWLAGVLRGSGLLLLQHDALWQAMDSWLTGLADEVFIERLPLLRRAFSGFTLAERRQMGDKLKHLGGPQARVAASAELDGERAAMVLPVLAAVLGTAKETTQ